MTVSFQAIIFFYFGYLSSKHPVYVCLLADYQITVSEKHASGFRDYLRYQEKNVSRVTITVLTVSMNDRHYYEHLKSAQAIL